MYFALAKRGALRPGETVLVLGSAGGVGTAAIQIAKALGAKVIAMVHRPHAAEFVESLGADLVLPLTDGWLEAVKEHTGGQGVDLVVDPIGGEAFDDAIRALATEGRLLVIGFAAGGIPTVKVNRLLLRNVAVIGVGYGEYVNRRPGSQSVFEFGVGRIGQSWTAATTAGALPAVEGRRRAAEPGRWRGARQGRAGAVMGPRALAFDVFGTVVDWRSSVIRQLEEFGRTPWAATGLAEFRRQLARRLCPGDGPGAPWRAAVDEDRRPASHDPRGTPWRGWHHVDLR